MFSLAIILCVTVALVYVIFNSVKYIITSRKHRKVLGDIPRDEDPHPIWGNLDKFPGPGEKGLQFMYNKLADHPEGKLVPIHYGPFHTSVMVFHFESVKSILKTSEPKPKHTLGGGYRFFLPWLGDGLLVSEGHTWSRSRRLLTPAFHFDILKPYIAINNNCTRMFLDKVGKLGQNGEYFEVFSQVSLLTLDIILKCAFSYDIDCQTMGYQHPYVKAVTEITESLVYRLLRPWIYPDWIYYLTPKGRRFKKNCDYVHSVSEDIVNKRREAFAKYGDSVMRHHKYIDFLDILLKATDTNDNGLTDSEIRDEVDTFLFEGHDTTASAIAWTLYSLAENPDIQAKCQKEVDSILEGRETDDITWDDLNQLPYVAMCIKEAMRLHSPVPYIQRMLTKDMTIDGNFIPKNTIIEINIYLLHHNPSLWDQPFAFIPERFSSENIEKQDPFQYVPFSAGPRNCIGQNFAMHEMKVVIAKILRSFKLETDPNRQALHEIKTVMKTENGMYLRFTPRSH